MDSSPDDLELNLIGAIYRGPWEKKYWSCSRGKDRHPYPVGYHAVRAHAGTRYRMEIHQGPRGPLFTVTSYDGEEASGPTPDLAWRAFQKKTAPTAKIWHGKRLSSKVDGAELFGFRNAQVLRLLRQLLSSSSGAASSDAMGNDQTDPDLLGKRKRTVNTTEKKKKNTRAIGEEPTSTTISLATTVHNLVGNEDQGLPFMQVDTSAMEPEISDCFTRELDIPCEQIKDRGFHNPEARGGLSCAEDGQCERLSDDLLEQRHFFDETEDSAGDISSVVSYSDTFVAETCDTERDDTTCAAPEKAKEIPCSTKHTEAEATSRASTFCTSADVITASEFINKRKSSPSNNTCSIPPKACTPLDSPSKGLIKDSLSEFDSSGSPNLNSGRIDLDVAGQELAKSMMSCLLPMAVPLLVKRHVRRRSRHRKRDVKCDPSLNSSEAHLVDMNANKNALQGNNGTRLIHKQPTWEHPREVIEPLVMAAIGSPCKETKVQPSLNSCKIELNFENDTKAVVSDSLEDDRYLSNIALERPSPSIYHDGDAPLDEDIEHRNDTSNTDVNHIAGHEKLSYFPFANDEPGQGVVQPVELEIANSVLSDSVARKHPNRITTSVKSMNQVHLHADDTSWNTNDNILCLRSFPIKHDSSFQNDDLMAITKEDMLLLEDMVARIPIRRHKAELCEEDFPASSCKKFTDNEVRSTQAQTYRKNDSPSRQRSSPSDQFDVPIVDSKVVSQTPQKRLVGKAVITSNDSYLCSVPPPPYCTSGSSKEGHRPQLSLSSGIYDIPPTKSMMCTGLSNYNRLNTCSTPKKPFTFKSCQTKDQGTGALTGVTANNAIDIHKMANLAVAVKNVTISEPTVSAVAPSFYKDHNPTNKVTSDGKASKVLDPSVSCFKKYGKDIDTELLSPIEWRKDFSDANTNNHLGYNICKNNPSNRIYQKHVEQSSTKYTNSTKEAGGTLELVGCYLHPHPVLSIFLSSKEGNLRISVLCGISRSTERTLFMYTVPIVKQIEISPTFLGYTSLVLPLLQGPCDESISFESSRLHFIPDEESLVFLNNIKAPHCREKNIGCLCSNCKSDCTDAYAIEVAYVKFGYISSVAKLRANERISCSLVCGPYLIAAEESGRLHVWVKNQTWSGNLEEFLLPKFDHISPAILELKMIPACDSVIIGHNGIGGFGIWDITQRVLLASFSSPGNTIFQIVPVGLLNWHDKGTLASNQEQKQGSRMANSWMSNTGGNPTATSSREDLAVWVLVSAASDLEARYNELDQLNTCHVGWWRLAILAKNKVVLGNLLDPRASAVDVFADYGIIGTCDGLLYKWNLSSGEKLVNLQPLNCGISRIAIDAESGAVAVAGENRQLLVYVQH